MKKAHFLALVFTGLGVFAKAQVLFNEASSKNDQVVLDQFNESSDWIELYNTADSAINLSNYYLSDDADNKLKWQIEKSSIDALGYTILFASDRDLRSTSSAIPNYNALKTHVSGYADSTATAKGDSYVLPLDHSEIYNDATKTISARIYRADNGENSTYAGINVSLTPTNTPINLSSYNEFVVKGSIQNQRSLIARFVQDGLDSWRGYGFRLNGDGTEFEYHIPLYDNASGLDMSKIEFISLESSGGKDEFTDVRISEMYFSFNDTIGGIHENYYTYADESNENAGESTVVPLDYSDVISLVNNQNVISATLNMADNSGPGKLGFSYAGISCLFGGWNTIMNISNFSHVLIDAQISDNRSVMFRVLQDGTNSWEAFGQTLQGTGDTETYIVPLADEDILDLSKISGYQFEGLTPPGETEIRVFNVRFLTQKGDAFLHTNFKLSAGGETIFLSDPNGTTIDSLSIPELITDQSFGPKPDGSANDVVFLAPTPNTSNNGAASVDRYCEDVITFSTDAGFYNGTQSISLSGSDAIKFTLDGSEPTSTSTTYTQAIDVEKTTVIKAACFNSNELPRRTYVNTYFIDEQTDLPVFSLSTDAKHLFDENEGLFAFGPNANLDEYPYLGSNFWEDWEKPIYIEFFETDGSQQLELPAGVSIFGGWSRMHPSKSMRLKANKDYGPERMNYKFFKDKNIPDFRQILLRNSGNDFNESLYHDALNRNLIHGKTNNDAQAFRPAIAFINGEYWGILNLREKINEHFISENHGLNTDDIQLVDTWGGALHGEENNFWGIHYDVTNNDMSNQDNFDEHMSNFDYTNYIDFFATNIITSNWDWPQNNLKLWRPTGDGNPIRYITYDTDITLGNFGVQLADFDQIGRIRHNADDPHSEMFSSFIDNKAFQNDFINRSADLMNTIYQPDYIESEIDARIAEIDSEIPRHLDRWAGEYAKIDYTRTYSSWLSEKDATMTFVDTRLEYARDQLQDEFSLVSQVDVTLKVSPEGAGVIKISTIIPESFPWSGVYYNGVPVTLTAIANPGYSFDDWESSAISLSNDNTSQITLNINRSNNFTAYFLGSSQTAKLAISELNYNSSDALDSDDWVELFNYENKRLDVSDWTFTDKKFNPFTFPTGTILEPYERIVLVSDRTKFESVHTNVSARIFDIKLKFSNGGETLYVLDRDKNTVTEMSYDDKNDWPIEADGDGYTLEVFDPAQNLSIPQNWFTGCIGGSPGEGTSTECHPTAIVDIDDSKNQFTVYPNPSQGIVAIYSDKNIGINEIQVIDILGSIVYSSKGNGNSLSELNLSGLPKGVYTINILSRFGINEQKKIILD